MARMNLAPKFSVPDLTTETIGIIGKRGSGKSHTGTLLVEELLELESQVIVIDPTGGWWGLRAGADGKSSGGFSIPIFGGLHGDIPLEERSGALLADYLVENRLSGVLDLSDFSKSAMRRFVRDFAERFYLLKNKARDPVHIVIDECDLFVPQRVDSADMLPLVGAINDFVLRGRQRGFGVTLISQRPARINKDVLTQVEILVAFRMTGPHDIKAFGEWIEHNGTKEEQKEVLATLSSLERGTGWFWAPGLMNGLLKRVSFRERNTYDSSRTPDGKKIRPPKTLRDVDLGQLSEAMKTTVEQAKANDPKSLRAEVARLKKELEMKFKKFKGDPAPPPIPPRLVIDKRSIKALARALADSDKINAKLAKHNEQLREHNNRLASLIDQWSQRAQVVVTECGTLSSQIKATSKAPPEIKTSDKVGTVARRPVVGLRNVTLEREYERQRRANGDASKIAESVKVPRSFAVAVAQFGDVGASRTQLTAITGVVGSTRNAYLQRGRNAGLFEEVGERHRITTDGKAWLGDYEELPSGSELREHWYRNLPSPQSKILRVVAALYPQEVTRDEIGETLKNERWATSTRNAYIQRLVRRELLEETSRERVRMAETLADREDA